jgi:hypothetical protein
MYRGIEVNERAYSKHSKQSKKVEIANYCYQWHILKPSGKKDKEELHRFCQNTKRDRGERHFERFYRHGSALWLREIKMNRHAFVSINHVTAGHTSLKASLKDLILCPRPNAYVVTGCKRRNISFVIVNGMRSSGQQFSARCLLLHKQHSYIYLKIDM